MHRFYSDVRHACRILRKSPGFTVVALLTLALTLGANTAIFSFVNAVLLQPLPYPHADRIVRVLEAPPGGGRNGISTLNYLDWQRENRCFDYLAAITGDGPALTGVDEPTQLPGARVSPHYFDVFSLKAALGRTFVEGEDQPGHDHVAVLSHTLWQNKFGGDPAIVGRTIQLDGEPHTVIGVLPKGTAFERGGTRIWRPLTFTPANMTRDFHWFWAVARMKDGITLDQARAQMDAVGRRIAHDFPASNKGWTVGVDLFADTLVARELKLSIYVLFAAVGMVLLIACANLANLSLMRVVSREREIAIRIAIGAGRWALIRQFLTESLILSLAGAVLGLLVGQQTIAAITAALPSWVLPAEAHVGLDGPVLLFSFGLAALTAVIIGLFPGLHAARPNLTNSLKQGGSSSAGSHGRLRSTLVVAEIALAFVLLTGAGLLIRSLNNLSRVDPGVDVQNVLTCWLPIPEQRYPESAAVIQYKHAIREKLRALPGVTDVAFTSALPMQGWGYGMPFQIADEQIVDRANRSACFFKMVSASYFSTLHMRLVRGRLLAESDQHGAPPVTVVNETMVKRYFKGANPIGKRLLVQEIVPGKTQLGTEVPWEIVGVVADEKVGGMNDSGNSPGMYVTTDQSPTYGAAVLVRSATDTALLREPLKQAIHSLNPSQTVSAMKTLAAIHEETMVGDRIRATLLGAFAGVSLLLATLGIYGVISYSISQRTREIGVRTALGATRGDILRLVLGQGLKLALIGLLVGVIGAFGVTRVLASMLFGVGQQDPITLTTVAVALAGVAVVAALLPARRATKVDPLVALRCE